MTSSCQICADPTDKAGYCPPCSGLLRWVREHFSDFPSLAAKVVPDAGLFNELDVHSLDYMDWLLEAEEKLDIDIADHQAAEIETVGQFVRMLKEAGACWPKHREIQVIHIKWLGLSFTQGWVAVDRPLADDTDRA